MTRLLGQSPAGLSATGDSDTRNYYDMIAARQALDLRPQLERLDRLILASEGLDPAALTFAFRPLWQMDAASAATVALTKAQATQIYAGLGLWPTAVTARLVESQVIADGTYPNAAAVFAEAGAAPVEDAGTGDAFPTGLGTLHYLTEPREANGRWTTGGGSPDARLSLVSDPEKAKRLFGEGLAGGRGPLDDPIAPPGEDPITDPLPHAATHGPMESVPAPLAAVPIMPVPPSAQPSLSPVASKAPTVAVPSTPAVQPTPPVLGSPTIGQTDRTKVFSPQETTTLRELFRGGGDDSGVNGAQRLLDQLSLGPITLPQDLTLDIID